MFSLLCFLHQYVISIWPLNCNYDNHWRKVQKPALKKAGLKLTASSVQFSHTVMSDSLWPHGLQNTRPPCPSPTPGIYSNSCSTESVTPSNHFILYHPLLLPPSIFPSIRVFSNESVLHIRWWKYWSFSFIISPSNKYSGLILLGWTDWISLMSKGFSRVFSNTICMDKRHFYKMHQNKRN